MTLPPQPLRLAAAQATCAPGDLPANVRTVARTVAHAADEGARLVVFPELQTCGYDLPALARDPHRGTVAADPTGTVNDARLDALAAAAVDHPVTVLLGAAVRRPDGALTNSLLVADGSGIRVAYDKQHLWHDDEARLFRPGRSGAAITVGGWRLALSICYDMSFPEHARQAALGGAHAYLSPSAFAAGGEHRAAIYLASRALENTIFSLFVNPVGGPEHRPCNGGSILYGPDGVAVTAAGAEANLIVADLDAERIGDTRQFLRMLAEVERGPVTSEV